MLLAVGAARSSQPTDAAVRGRAMGGAAAGAVGQRIAATVHPVDSISSDGVTVTVGSTTVRDNCYVLGVGTVLMVEVVVVVTA